MDDKAAKREQLKAELKNLRVWYQFVIGIIVVLGAFMAGTAGGWSSPAASLLKKEGIDDEMQLAWVASIFALGAAASQFIIMGFIAWLGIKWSIVISHVIVILGWVTLTVTYNYYLLLLGRFVCGMAGGFAVACPMYIAETAHKHYRGTIGVFFQLFITLGIVFAFVAGIFKNMIILNIACVSGSVLGLVLTILFVPESPYALLKKNKREKFDTVMRRFRGKNYDYSKEEAEMKSWVDNKESWKDGFKDPLNLRAFGVLLGLHIIQQLSGVNAILFHAHTIFEMSGTTISDDLSVVIIGVAQVVFCLIAAATVDHVGRIILFIISLGLMCICLAMTGVFFAVDDEWRETLSLVPTIALVIYICGFSLGAGPLPWAMLGEYLPSNAKTVMSTIIASINFTLVFGTAWMMPVMLAAFSPAYIFFGFAVVCFLGIVFVMLFVVETNQKTLEQIREDIAAHKPGDLFRKKQGA